MKVMSEFFKSLNRGVRIRLMIILIPSIVVLLVGLLIPIYALLYRGVHLEWSYYQAIFIGCGALSLSIAFIMLIVETFIYRFKITIRGEYGKLGGLLIIIIIIIAVYILLARL